jgi:hypothetical protein
MKRALLVIVAIFLVSSVFLVISAFGDGLNSESTDDGTEAQVVKGNSYFGQFITTCGDTITSCMAFDRDGFITFDDGLTGFRGTYNEVTLGQDSIWIASLTDTSPSGNFLLAGISQGRESTFMLLVNVDQNCPATETPILGFGNLSKINCTPIPPGPGGEEDSIGGVDTEKHVRID